MSLPARTAHVHHDHAVQFYDSSEYLVRVVGDFLIRGLSEGAPAIVIATPEHRRAVTDWLASNGLDPARVSMLDAGETLSRLMVEGRPNAALAEAVLGPVLQRLSLPGKPIHAYGEMVDVLVRSGNAEAAIRLEELWNDLAERYHFTLLCGYHMASFDAGDDLSVLDAICDRHAQSAPTESYAEIATDEQSREIARLQQRARALEREIEERKRVEEELRAAVAHREEFLSVASHELRTPIAALRLNLESLTRLARATSTPEIVARAERTSRSVGRLTALVDELLDVSRIATGRLRLDTSAVNLSAVVIDTVAELADTAAKNHCELLVVAPQPVFGHWDALRLAQLITNLVGNAIKYGRGEPVEISVERRGPRAILVVRDRGIGIPVEDQERIFKRFERASSSRHFGGLGLGLWIAREIAEAHGGTIRVESEPSRGARFEVTLPASTGLRLVR